MHKAMVSAAFAEGSRGDVVADRPDYVGNLVERFAKDGRRLRFCYERRQLDVFSASSDALDHRSAVPRLNLWQNPRLGIFRTKT